MEIGSPGDYRAALYIRLSKEDDNEGLSESVNNQRSLLNEFAGKNRLVVYDTYIDDGWTGTNFDRPEFRRMIGDIERGKVNMVITKDLSRLGRDYIMTGHYMERYFPEKRVRYISLLDGIDTGVESSANDITPFRAIMNDMYAKDISKKIKSVKRDKQRKGQFIGGKPMFGYKMHPTKKNQIVVDEEAAQIVRRIFAMALEGVSCRKIATQLNEDHVPTPAAYAGLTIGNPGPYTGLWSSERISEMLQNETYIGNMVQGRTVKISYKSKKCLRQARENWVVVEGTHEPLIDAEIFQKVQMLVNSRKRTRSRTYDFLLRGLIFCHECGYPMAVINRRNAAGEERLFLICRTYQRFTKDGVCSCHSIKEKTVADAVLAKVQEVCKAYFNPLELLSVAEDAVAEADKAAGAEAGIRSLRNRIDTLTAHLDKMYMDKLSGILSEADFQRIYLKVKDDRAQLEERLKVLEREKENPVPKEDGAKELVRRFLDSVPTNRELLVSLIERVEVTEDKQLIIKFRFREPEMGLLAKSFTIGETLCIADRENSHQKASGGTGEGGDVREKRECGDRAVRQ
ncbi:MAG: recombinase family protein [Eubacteriales bacterium]|nr:recombinase family protein [Eubacteriales bacterium]